MKKKENKKMPSPRHKVIHNPIPTSLFCFNMLLYFSKGDNLDSVERSEISVTVAGEECEDRTSPNDDPNTVSGNNSPTITIILIFASCSMCVKYQVNLPTD